MFGALLRIYRETGIRLQHINLGGGFPVNYLRDGAGRRLPRRTTRDVCRRL
ncbi:MAG: hypothetical protein IPM21_10575 [Acidobacteria bacterium]|nr:hypothetical protein [Acidobacteriota bacterium]